MISGQFTPLPSLIGGLFIGASASFLWWSIGKPAGISGIWGNLLKGDYQLPFVGGLLVGGIGVFAWAPEMFGAPVGRSLPALALAGLLVGFGTRMSGGCTSGHGVCGLSRRSPRSLLAVVTFMAVGALTATLVGGAR